MCLAQKRYGRALSGGALAVLALGAGLAAPAAWRARPRTPPLRRVSDPTLNAASWGLAPQPGAPDVTRDQDRADAQGVWQRARRAEQPPQATPSELDAVRERQAVTADAARQHTRRNAGRMGLRRRPAPPRPGGASERELLASATWGVAPSLHLAPAGEHEDPLLAAATWGSASKRKRS